MKRITAVILAAALIIIALPLASVAEGTTSTLYFNNIDGWHEVWVAFYDDNGNYWEQDENSYPYFYEMTLVNGTVYKFDNIPTGYPNVAFSAYSYWLGMFGYYDILDYTKDYYDPKTGWGTYGASATTDPTSTTVGNSGNAYDIGVNGEFVLTETPSVVSADIAWEAMTFEYNAGNMGSWDASEHEYSGVTQGAFTSGRKQITVTNHSNTPIKAEYGFTQSKIGHTYGMMVYFLSQRTGDSYAVSASYLDSAEGKTTAEAPKDEVYADLDSSYTVDQSMRAGTITVKIGKIKDKVSNQTELWDAMAFGRTTTLSSGITIFYNLTNWSINPANNSVLDLDMYALRFCDEYSGFYIYEDSTFTLKNGFLFLNYSYCDGIENCGNVTLENLYAYCNVRNYGGRMLIKDCYIKEYALDVPYYTGKKPITELQGNTDVDISDNNPYTVLMYEGVYDSYLNPFTVLKVHPDDADKFEIQLDDDGNTHNTSAYHSGTYTITDKEALTVKTYKVEYDEIESTHTVTLISTSAYIPTT